MIFDRIVLHVGCKIVLHDRVKPVEKTSRVKEGQWLRLDGNLVLVSK